MLRLRVKVVELAFRPTPATLSATLPAKVEGTALGMPLAWKMLLLAGVVTAAVIGSLCRPA